MKQAQKNKKTTNERTKNVARSEHSKQQNTTPQGETAQDAKGFYGGLWLALIGVVVLLTILVTALVLPQKPAEKKGELVGVAELRYGEHATYEVRLRSTSVKETDEIVWKVNGKEAFREKAGHASTHAFDFCPNRTGEVTISVEVSAREIAKKVVIVQKPLLVAEVTSCQKEYGTANPPLKVTFQGFVDGDTAESLNFSPTLQTDAQQNSDVGTYPVTVVGVETEKYDVTVREGTLTILPKVLALHFTETEKVYDGTASFCGTLCLDTLEGDDVSAEYDAIAFDNAAVGERRIVLSGLKLTGDKAKNYRIEAAEARGKICPKPLRLTGLKVNDKIYDGTTAVSFAAAGTLEGVLDGDFVGVGKLKARFESASSGRGKKVVVDSVELIGTDSENYVVLLPTDVRGNVKGNNKFLDFAPSVPGSEGR